VAAAVAGGACNRSAAAPAMVEPRANQAHYLFDHFGPEDGLPHTNVILAALQTHDGYLWVGTEMGLARFDGVRFVSFRSSNTPAFPSNLIECLHEDRAGTLWIGTERGLVRYRDGAFSRIALPEVPIRALAEDETGRLWIGTYGRGILWLDGDRVRSLPEPLPSPFVLALFVDTAGRVWTGLERFNGVLCYDHGVLRRVDGGGRIDSDIQTICELPRGTLWLGGRLHRLFRVENDRVTRFTPNDGLHRSQVYDVRPAASGGLWVTAGALQQVTSASPFTIATVPHLPSESISAVCEDYEGSLWLCARESGLIRARPVPYRSITTTDGLPNNGTKTVAEDREHNLWLGIQSTGVVKLTPEGKTTVYTEADGLANHDPWTVVAARDGSIWVGSHEALCVWREGAWHTYRDLRGAYGVYEDRNGAMWLATADGRLWCFRDGAFHALDLALSHPVNRASAFAEAADGTLYIGIWDSGLLQLKDGKALLIDHRNGLPADDVRAVHVDVEGRVWVGFRSRGLAVRAGGKWYNADPLAEALTNHVTAIVEHGDQLWLGTTAGVMWASKSDLLAAARGTAPVPKLRVAEMTDGLGTAAVWSGAQPIATTTHDGQLLFATRRGLLAIDPEHLPSNSKPPPVHVERVLVDRQAAPAGPEVMLPAGTRDLAIEYTALTFVQPNRVQFRYKLEGYDRDWIEPTGRRTAFYTNLPVGDYVFRVKACNHDGVWNETGAAVRVRQLPHFYQTWWFGALALAGLVSAGFGVNRWSHRRLASEVERLEEKQAMERERRRIARNLHDSLGATLTEIGLFTETARAKTESAETAEDMAFLAGRVRELATSLDAVVWAINPANDTVDRLAVYLCEVFQDLLRVSTIRGRLEIGEEFPRRPISPEARSNVFLTAKEATHNMLKHSGATEAWLRLHMQGETLHLTLSDNGRGFDPAAPVGPEHNGLANMRTRIEELNGSFTIESAPGRGTTIRIAVNFGAGPVSDGPASASSGAPPSPS
jgi:signal transduction histidine kinase